MTVYWTHFSSAFLAFPWILVATFQFARGLAVSELTMLFVHGGCAAGQNLQLGQVAGQLLDLRVQVSKNISIIPVLSDVLL